MTNTNVTASGDRLYFILIGALVFIYVIIRAALVPWVHDESTSIFWYCERGEFLPYASLWDAGNHYLSTAIGVLAYQLWELSLLGSRIGSVLAFPVYAWAVFRIGNMLPDRMVRSLCWLTLLTCPFLIDFFSLFRGYGLGMAFWMVAIDGGIRYYRSTKNGHLVQLLLGLFLADMAVLSIVPIWAMVVAIVGSHLLLQWYRSKKFPSQKVLLWSGLGAIPLMFGLLLAWEFRRRALLYHGSTDGFIPVTLASLTNYVIGTDHIAVLLSICIILVAASVVIFSSRPHKQAAVILIMLLGTDVLMRIGMAWLLEVNYPEDRAALHMVPVTILIVAFAANACRQRMALLKFFFMIALVVLPARAIITANLDHTLLWPEQSVPARFIEQITAIQETSERPLVIGAYHQLSYSMPYSARLNGTPVGSPDVKGFPFGDHDIKIADDRFISDARIGYVALDHAPGNGLHLLVRDSPLSLETSEWSTLIQGEADAEFLEIWADDGPDTTHGVRVEVECTIDADQALMDVYLVVSQELGNELVHYHNSPLAHERAVWSGEKLHWMVRLPYLAADRRVVYFWNQKKVPLKMENSRYRIHRVLH